MCSLLQNSEQGSQGASLGNAKLREVGLAMMRPPRERPDISEAYHIVWFSSGVQKLLNVDVDLAQSLSNPVISI